MPMSEPTALPPAIALAVDLSSRNGTLVFTARVSVDDASPLSRIMVMTSEKANIPRIIAASVKPLTSSICPAVNLGSPVIRSMPTVPTIRPRIAEMMLLTKSFELITATARIPSIPSRKYSG
jgi:hypothetical protein